MVGTILQSIKKNGIVRVSKVADNFCSFRQVLLLGKKTKLFQYKILFYKRLGF